MPDHRTSSFSHPLDDNHLWCQLYPRLTSYVWTHMRKARVQSWYGQEYDIVEDIVQETVVRIFLYMRQAKEDEKVPIHSLPAFGRRTAHNHLVDLQRKTARLIHPLLKEYAGDYENAENVWEHWISPIEPIEELLEEMSLTGVLVEVAPFIARLPQKQRTALLIDLASLTDFAASAGALEKALLDVDIHLRNYQEFQPTTAKERSQTASLRWVAYKRLREVTYPHLRHLNFVD